VYVVWCVGGCVLCVECVYCLPGEKLGANAGPGHLLALGLRADVG
jgi:hypothetical protein